MSEHLPECECYGRNHGECALCICDRLRACEQRVRMEDDDYAYVAAQAEAEGRWRGWVDALDAARKAIREIPGDDMCCTCPADERLTLAAIDALREERK